MKWRWILLVVTLLLVLLSAYQADTVRRLRTEARQYETKVETAFRYTARQMDLTSLPEALAALEAEPSPESLERAKAAASQYGEMLLQLNDLRESGSPMLQGGFSTGDYTYVPSTPEQGELSLQIWQARSWPSLYSIGVLLPENDWELRPEDRRFLADMRVLVEQLNGKLSAVVETLNRSIVSSHEFDWAKMALGEIGPELEAMRERIEAHRATFLP